MQALAQFLGTLIGYSIGYTLKIAGPELRAFLVGVLADAIEKAFDDRAVVGKPNADLQRMWAAGDHRAAGDGDDVAASD